ncbi:hypothetical protein BpHYR1_024254 [Brachionus plicatilis]|uniref:Uncharacterized protein n=1 Tax=Brachionus plicatilis TaxID=10195 RepID=A0A3M7PKM1_BRAPC|nr:hypothetical protein BpHYR1_024254 [Brachionus plicatilis]
MSQKNNSESEDDCLLNNYMEMWEKLQKEELCMSFAALKLEPNDVAKLNNENESSEEQTNYFKRSTFDSFDSSNKKN